MSSQRALQLTDIPWLRLSGRKAGVLDVPREIASKLLAGGLVERTSAGACLMITSRGKLALTRLG